MNMLQNSRRFAILTMIPAETRKTRMIGAMAVPA